MKKNKTEQICVSRADFGKKAGIVGIILNFFLFIIKIFTAVLSSSISIAADAVNNLSDMASSIISFVGFKMSEKPADSEHPYGHGRYEYIAGLTVAIMIIVIGVELLKTSVEKIISPYKIEYSPLLAAILIISIFIKLIMMFFYKKTAKKINSKTLIAAAKDSRNDCFTTLAVLISCIVSQYTNLELDGWAGLLVALFILLSGIGIIKETINPMLGIAPDAEFVNRIKDKILSYPGVLGVHDILVHDYGASRKFASVHVEMAAEENVMESHEIIDNMEKYFLENEGLNVIIHFDPVITQSSDLRKKAELAVKQINPLLTIHDFKAVPTQSGLKLSFDCNAEAEKDLSDDDLKYAIKQKIKDIDSSFECDITIDRSFAPPPHQS